MDRPRDSKFAVVVGMDPARKGDRMKVLCLRLVPSLGVTLLAAVATGNLASWLVAPGPFIFVAHLGGFTR
jgi:hypothetical protein